MSTIARLGATVLDCPEPHRLADFYSALLGWPVLRANDDDGDGETDWVELDNGGNATIAFQLAPDYQPPSWPSDDHPQQLHIDLDVDDLDAAEVQVLRLGARKHEVQPKPDSFRVYLDLAGHPFCLCQH